MEWDLPFDPAGTRHREIRVLQSNWGTEGEGGIGGHCVLIAYFLRDAKKQDFMGNFSTVVNLNFAKIYIHNFIKYIFKG